MTRLQAVEVADLFEWLPRASAIVPGAAVVAVLPDSMELGQSITRWEDWFIRAARECFLSSGGPTVFLQTDRMVNGRWISKPALLERAADAAWVQDGTSRAVLWHKIVQRRDTGKVDLHRPTYSHLIAYGPGRPGKRTPDVIVGGKPSWRNGIGPHAAATIARYLRDVGITAVLNPGCGEGTILEACCRSMRVYGCDVDEVRARTAAANLDPLSAAE